MKNLKQKFALATATLAAAGCLAFSQASPVEAADAEWEARTVEEVQADLAAAEDGATTYTVKWGDTLGVIAKALDVDLGVLTQANSIANADQIVAGTTIIVSADHSTVTATSPSGQSSTANSQGQVSSGSSSQGSSQGSAPAQSAQSSGQAATYSSNATGGEAAAKEWIAQRESNGSYTAYNPNGGYYGRYQLNPSLIHYGASPAEQEAAADRYVANRYGSWTNAKSFWQSNGWY